MASFPGFEGIQAQNGQRSLNATDCSPAVMGEAGTEPSPKHGFQVPGTSLASSGWSLVLALLPRASLNRYFCNR